MTKLIAMFLQPAPGKVNDGSVFFFFLKVMMNGSGHMLQYLKYTAVICRNADYDLQCLWIL